MARVRLREPGRGIADDLWHFPPAIAQQRASRSCVISISIQILSYSFAASGSRLVANWYVVLLARAVPGSYF